MASRFVSMSAALALGLASSACHPRRIVTVRAPDACGELTVDGDRILCGGQPFAEVQRFAPGPGACSGVPAYRGLAVRYATGERAWLFRATSMDPEHPERYPGARSEGEFKLGWIGDVRIAKDGRTIHFRRPAILFPDRFEYDVVAGTLRKVKWTPPEPPAEARVQCGAGSGT